MASNDARMHLDQRLSALPSGSRAARPRLGWLRAVRDALGMTTTQLGVRVGVSAAAVTQAEHSEQADTIRLQTLRRFADALDCEVVYYLVPRSGSLQATVDRQVDTAARRLAERVGQTMALEDQNSVGVVERWERLREAVSKSRKIW